MFNKNRSTISLGSTKGDPALNRELEAQRQHHLAAVDDEDGQKLTYKKETPLPATEFRRLTPEAPRKLKAPHRPAEGHEIGLATIIKNKSRAELRFICTDEVVVGRVTAFDRYTISIMVDGESKPRVYYKSSIFYFQEVA